MKNNELDEEYIEKNKKYFNYLEWLRRTGVTNMFGARPYLESDMKLESGDAEKILIYWMENYTKLREKFDWDNRELLEEDYE